MTTSIATERMTSINSISEFSNTTLPMISDSTPTTSIKTSTFDAKTQTNEIQTNTLRIISNSVSIYQSMFDTTTATDISGSFEIPIQTMGETFTMTGYTLSSYNEIISPSTFEKSSVVPQTFSETSISLSVDTLSDILIHTLLVSSGSLIATDASEFSIWSMTISTSYVGDSYILSLSTPFSSVSSLMSATTDSAIELTNISRSSNFSLTTGTVISPITTATVDSSAKNTVLSSKQNSLLSISENNSRFQQIETNTESPLMSTSFINQISYSSEIEEPSLSSYQDLSETSVTLSKISLSIHLSSSIIDTMDHFIYTTNTLITSYLDDTRHSFDDFTGGSQTFSQDYAVAASTSFAFPPHSTDDRLSLHTTEYYETLQTDFTSHVTTSLYKSHTKNATTSEKSYNHTSGMPSQIELASLNDVEDSTTDFEADSQSNDAVFSSDIFTYLLSTLQTASPFSPFNKKANASTVKSYIVPTNMLSFESQSSILTMDRSLFTNLSSIEVSTMLLDFKTTLLTTTIDFGGKIMPSTIKPTSKQTKSCISYTEINTSFKDSSFSFGPLSGSLASNYPFKTSLLSGLSTSISTLSTNTVDNGLAEKSKNIIFISTSAAVLTITVLIFVIIFAKVYISKNSNSSPPDTALPDYSFTGKLIYPLLNTSTTSLEMYPYEHNWKDIV